MTRLTALLMGLTLMATACGTDPEATEIGAEPDVEGVTQPVPSAEATVTAVEPVSDEELAILITSNNNFSADLYRTLADDDTDNLALGTWSVSEGLALPFVGARGSTAAQMAEVLRYDLQGDTLHEAFHTLRGELLDRQNDRLSMSIANRLFGQEGFGFLDDFLADQSAYYEAPLATVDFGHPEAAREAINEWTSARTNDKITELFSPGSIDITTRLVLVNAIHFDADWHFPFNPDLTRLESFTTLDGDGVNVEMMNFNEYLPIAEIGEHIAVELPYSGEEMSMIVVRPGGSLDTLEADLDAGFFASVRSGLDRSGIHLSLPKFELSSHHDLIPPLRELGLSEPFDNADFSGITGGRDLFIAAVEHEAFVRIDEAGTEAAAATGTAMAGSHGPTIVFDQPFLFYVQDNATGAVLFLGRVTNPDPTR